MTNPYAVHHFALSIHNVKARDITVIPHVSKGGSYWLDINIGEQQITLFTDSLIELGAITALFQVEPVKEHA